MVRALRFVVRSSEDMAVLTLVENGANTITGF
jgi:hypothetical protein